VLIDKQFIVFASKLAKYGYKILRIQIQHKKGGIKHLPFNNHCPCLVVLISPFGRRKIGARECPPAGPSAHFCPETGCRYCWFGAFFRGEEGDGEEEDKIIPSLPSRVSSSAAAAGRRKHGVNRRSGRKEEETLKNWPSTIIGKWDASDGGKKAAEPKGMKWIIEDDS
jgi:hypothetical protein